jgi:predicted RNA binding protein YcfA (HicA-like mRNA interferase family)
MDKLKAYGWVLDRINGSHHVFTKSGRRPVSDPYRAIGIYKPAEVLELCRRHRLT